MVTSEYDPVFYQVLQFGNWRGSGFYVSHEERIYLRRCTPIVLSSSTDHDAGDDGDGGVRPGAHRSTATTRLPGFVKCCSDLGFYALCEERDDP